MTSAACFRMLRRMLKIRLARVGKRGHATFRLVVTEHTRPTKSGFLEMLGSYDPHRNHVQLHADRVRHYLNRGVHVSPTVQNLLVDQGILPGPKVAARKYPKVQPAEPSTEQTGSTASEGSSAEAPVAEPPRA